MKAVNYEARRVIAIHELTWRTKFSSKESKETSCDRELPCRRGDVQGLNVIFSKEGSNENVQGNEGGSNENIQGNDGRHVVRFIVGSVPGVGQNARRQVEDLSEHELRWERLANGVWEY